MKSFTHPVNKYFYTAFMFTIFGILYVLQFAQIFISGTYLCSKSVIKPNDFLERRIKYNFLYGTSFSTVILIEKLFR